MTNPLVEKVAEALFASSCGMIDRFTARTIYAPAVLSALGLDEERLCDAIIKGITKWREQEAAKTQFVPPEVIDYIVKALIEEAGK